MAVVLKGFSAKIKFWSFNIEEERRAIARSRQRIIMASRTAKRPLQCIIKRSRPICECASSRAPAIRQFSASTSRPEEVGDRPRWAHTPENMKAPFPWKPKNPKNAFECNDDPQKLDRFYNNFLGRGGDQMLTEEIKWLAITHKSFDQGRRGFNDRLAFFGMKYSIKEVAARLIICRTTNFDSPDEFGFGQLAHCYENTIGIRS